MVIVGKCNETNIGIPPHLHEDDKISCIITLGSSNNGGDTDYHDGLKNNIFGVKQISVPFKHCQLQIGCSDKIYHGVCSWYGNRFTLNFNLKKIIIDPFPLYGMKYYKRYQQEGFPRFFMYNK